MTEDRRLAARTQDRRPLSRKDLGGLTGLSYPYIAQIETGYRLPSMRHQVPIAKAMGMSLDELFNTTDRRKAHRLAESFHLPSIKSVQIWVPGREH